MDQTEQLADLLVEWEERKTNQPTLTVDEFLSSRPDWIAPFRRLLVDLGQIEAFASNSENTPEPPQLVGRYHPFAFHAQGGLGQVFRAKDGEVGRDVAVKVIRPDALLRGGSRSRFIREAELTGRLEHPGIVPVYGLCNDRRGQPYYAMRFVEGATFEHVIQDYHAQSSRDPSARNVELRRLLRHFVAVCETMAYVHEQGVIHRDIKPKNIMIGRFGETIVVDWGLAKNLKEPRPEAESIASPRPSTGYTTSDTPKPESVETIDGLISSTDTKRGELLGTPAFMSPEQARGEIDQLGPASDIYSLGASLYQLLTGRPPFTAASVGALNGKAAEQVNQAEFLAAVAAGRFIPPHLVSPEVPRALAAICLKAMHANPLARYGSAKEMAEDVERWLADEPVRAWHEPFIVRARRWLRHHRTLVTGSVAALLVSVIAAFALAAQQRDAFQKEKKAHENEISLNGKLSQSIDDVNVAYFNLNEVNRELAGANLRERKARNEAIDQREEALRTLYLARMNFVGSMLEQPNYEYAWKLLRESRPLPGQHTDYRGVEWYLAWNLFERPELKSVEVPITAHDITISQPGDRMVLVGNRVVTVIRVNDGKRLFSATMNATQPKVSASREGRLLAIANDRKSIEVWSVPELQPGVLHAEFKPFTKSLEEIAISPDGNRLVAVGDNGKIAMFDIAAKKELWSVATLQDKDVGLTPVRSPSFTADGKTLCFLHQTRPRFWNVDLNQEIAVEKLPDGDFYSMRVTGADSICLWDYNGRLCTGVIEKSGMIIVRHEMRVRSWEFRNLPNRFVFHTTETQRLFTHQSLTTVREVPLAGEGPLTLVLSDGSLLGFRSTYYQPRRLFGAVLGQLPQRKLDDPVPLPIPFPKPIRAFDVTPDGKYIAIVAKDGSVVMGETARFLEPSLEFRHPGPQGVAQLLFTPQGSLVSLAADLSVAKGKPQGEVEGRLPPLEHSNPYLTIRFPRRSMALSPDGKRFAVREERRLEVVNADGGDVVSYLTLEQKSLMGSDVPMVFVPGKSTLVFANEAPPPRGKISPENCYLVVWDYGSFEEAGVAMQMAVGTWPSVMPRLWVPIVGKHSKSVFMSSMIYKLDVSPDGRWLAAGARDGFVKLFDLNQIGKFPPVPPINLRASGAITALRFSSDGNWLAAGCSDGSIRVWSIPSCILHMELPVHRESARNIAFAPDNRSLVSGGADGRVRFLSLTYRQDHFALNLHVPVESLAFNPTGNLLAIGGQNGEVRYHRATTDAAISEAARRRFKSEPNDRDARRDYFIALWGLYLNRSTVRDKPNAAAALREAVEAGKALKHVDAELQEWLAEFARALEEHTP